MNYQKIMLVAINSQFVHSNLAIRYLKKACEVNNINIEMREFTINQRVESVVRDIYETGSKLICFSAYIWNIEFIHKAIETLKAIDENMTILCGGPEVSFDSKECLLNSRIDFIIEGEGEETFLDFLRSFPDKDEIKKIRGIYSKFDGTIFYAGKRPPLKMEDMNFPYDEGDNLENKILYYESSRGCPFKCSYCLSSISNEVRFRDVEIVKEELKYFIDKKVKLVKFVDRTFNCNSKFSYEIWKFLLDIYHKIKFETSFHFEISADLFTRRELILLKRAPRGLFQFEIGVQSTNIDVIKKINRKMDFIKLKNNVKYLKDNTSINIHLDLIAGLPMEDKASFINSFNEVYALMPNQLQLGFLKIIKGSPISFEKEKWGIKHNPSPPYEILSNDFIDFNDILEFKMVEEVLDKYYNSGKFDLVLKFLNTKFSTPYEMYFSLASYLKDEGMFQRSISNEDYYRALHKFAKFKFKDESEIVKDLIRFQYLFYDKKKRDILFELDSHLSDDMVKIRKNVGNDYFVSKFTTDIMSFIHEGKIIKGDFIICFNKNNRENIIQLW